jgi:hypothetical protein
MTAIAGCHCLDSMPAVSHWLRYADSARVVNESRTHISLQAKTASMVRENVIAQLANIQTHPSVRLALEEGGWHYTAGFTTSNVAILPPTTVPAGSLSRLPKIQIPARCRFAASPQLNFSLYTGGSIMIHAQINRDIRLSLADQILLIKAKKDLTFAQLTDGTGLSEAFVTAALLGQHALPADAARLVGEKLSLDEDAVLLLQMIHCAAVLTIAYPLTRPFIASMKSCRCMALR